MEVKGCTDIERRDFARLDFVVPLDYKVCRKETVSKLLEGYTSNISQSGVLCNIKNLVNENDILWLSFSRETLDFCRELEKSVLVYQNGVIGSVVRICQSEDNSYSVGIKFITREEKELTNIYSKVHFLLEGQKNVVDK